MKSFGRTFWAWAILAWTCALAGQAQARNTLETAVSLEAAYHSPASGRWLVILQSDEMRNHPELASGNRVFTGDDQNLWQLESSGLTPVAPDPSGAGEADRHVDFFRGLRGGREDSGELVMGVATAHIGCGNVVGPSPEDYARVSDAEQGELERKISSGLLRLHPLPEIFQPMYLFKTPKASANEFVFVEGPVFNFRSDYRVWLGPLKHWNEIQVATDLVSWKSQRPGEIRFSAGGGLYIPLTVDLVSSSDRDHRGSPSLIRSASAALQSLELPRLPRSTLEGLGFGKAEYATIHTPCDSPNGLLAQVSPRAN